MYSKVIQLYIYIYIYIHILFHILFHYGLLQDTEYSSLCYTVGPCCLSILYIVVCISRSHLEPCTPASNQRHLVSQAYQTPESFTIPDPRFFSPSHTSYLGAYRIPLILLQKFPCTETHSSLLPFLAIQWAPHRVKHSHHWLLSILVLNASGENAHLRDLQNISKMEDAIKNIWTENRLMLGRGRGWG